MYALLNEKDILNTPIPKPTKPERCVEITMEHTHTHAPGVLHLIEDDVLVVDATDGLRDVVVPAISGKHAIHTPGLAEQRAGSAWLRK